MVTILFDGELVDFQTQIINSIEQNNSKIGGWSISTWLKEYNKFTGLDKERGSFDEVQFLSKSPNAQKLVPDEKEMLKKVLTFYDWLKFPKEYTDEEEFGEIDPEIAKQMKYVSDHAQEIVDSIVAAEGGSVEVEEVVPAPVAAVGPAPSVPKPPSAPVREQTNFEKRLATVNSTRGEGLQELKQRVIQKTNITTKPTSEAWSKELNREVAAKELPAHSEPTPPKIRAAIPQAPKAVTQDVIATRPSPGSVPSTLTSMNKFEDLNKIEVSHLRQGPIDAQLELLKTKILSLASQSNVLPYYAVAQFEQSPLFKAYLSSGNAMVAGQGGAQALNQMEFEMMADFKKHIEQL
jgi:hypothetical protein